MAEKKSAEGIPSRSGPRDWVSKQFTRVEDVVYVGLAIVLAASALVLLVEAAIQFGSSVFAAKLSTHIVSLLDRLLLILMIVEVLYTVQVSFRDHVLVPEPFLIVGLIAGIRRVLVLTTELTNLAEKEEAPFRNALAELALLTILIVALVGSLVMLRRRHAEAVAER